MKKQLLGIGLSLLWFINACSSGSKQQQQEAVQSDEDENAAEVENNNNNNENLNEENNDSTLEGIATGDGQAEERVVIFVLQDDTPIYGEPSTESATVGNLMQGDPVVIYPTSPQWGQITSGRYIQMNTTSPSLVPRSKVYNKWIAQGQQ